MKKIFLSLLLLATVNAWSQIEKVLPAQPNPPRLVTDLTGTLSPDQKETMERKLVAYDDSTSNQIAVIIVPSTGDYDISDYAFALGRKWGIGNKKNNNGVVFLIAKNDRKVFIAPGYGLEGAIPDITVNRIIQNEVLPNFKANDFYRGIDYGTDAIMDAARGEYTAPEDYANRGRPRGIPPILIIFIVIFFLWLISRKGGGGSGGAFMSRRGYRNWNGPVIFPTGGWTGGGGGWSGGSGGGGFGGFGGGSFGGGGAGGSW